MLHRAGWKLSAARQQMRTPAAWASSIPNAPWPAPGRTPRRDQGAMAAGLVEQLKVVVAAEVVDEVDGVGTGLDRQAEQVAAAAGVAVDGLDRDLRPARGGLHHVPVAAVDGQDVVVGRDGQAARPLQRAVLGNGPAAMA